MRRAFVVTLVLALVGAAGWLGWSSLARTSAPSAPAPGLRAEEVQPARPATPGAGMDLRGRRLENRHAYIPPACYTKTRDADGQVHNPCYACHVASEPPNFADDADLQTRWSFQTPAADNLWTNLFVDRAEAVAATGDDAIDAYVGTDNYFGARGRIRLARALSPPPAGWDEDGDGTWDGYVPDCWFHFDERGFDRDPRGEPTGWRVFAYAPFLGTFFPTNGSADDVMIRLPAAFRRDEDGRADLDVYAVNLAVVEALIRRRDVSIEPVDETRYGVDLDRDGTIGEAARVAFGEDPPMSYVGRARLDQRAGTEPLAPGLYPIGTEFLHSVRYLMVRPDGTVGPASRMKELRYARKSQWRRPGQLAAQARREAREKLDRPDLLRRFYGDVESGVGNGQGWIYQGFIEDAAGWLRPQSFEETVYCIGCHSGIGATTDSSFALPRKLGAETHRRGFYHLGFEGPWALPEPVRADGKGEYALYLRANGAADELRQNAEARERFFDDSGRPVAAALETLGHDASVLLWPSPARARALDAAYRVIVREQSFVRGRDATVRPATEVHRHIDPGTPTGIGPDDVVPPRRGPGAP